MKITKTIAGAVLLAAAGAHAQTQVVSGGTQVIGGQQGSGNGVAGVSSVNGATGAVTLTIPTKTSQLSNDSGFVGATGAAAAAPVQSVNGQTGAVVISVGGAAAGYTDIGSALTSANVSSCTATNGLQVSQGATVASSVTVPASCALRFVPGGELLPASGVTVTINGSIQAPQNPVIFGGAGSIAGLTGTIPLTASPLRSFGRLCF